MLSQEDNDYITTRAVAYVTSTIEAYNAEAQNVVHSPENAQKEATAAISALATITISVIGSIAGNKSDMCAVLTNHIENLDKLLLDLQDLSEDEYSATPEDMNLGSL